MPWRPVRIGTPSCGAASSPRTYGWLFCALTAPGYAWSAGGLDAEHGAANPEDVPVPIVFSGPGIAAQRLARHERTVDIGPTLAAVIGIASTEAVDGRVLDEVLGH